MFFKSLFKAKSKIDKNSNNNTVIQNSTVNGPIIVSNSTEDLISILGKTGNYETIQDVVGKALSQVATVHPLQPDFSAKYDYKINRLVSTPETKEAFDKYPKIIKGTFIVDYSKFPFMHKDETPFEYAYRTQEKVEMETTAYKEYLGDIEDPFPTTTYRDGMITVVEPPEFPQAVKAEITSGNVSVPIMLRRLPCKDYGKLVLGNVSENPILDVTITHSEDQHLINLKNTRDADLETQLLREKLLANIYLTKELAIYVEGIKLIHSKLNDKELENDIFRVAPRLSQLIENIIIVQKETGCVFEKLPNTFSRDECLLAQILAVSLKNNYVKEELVFDDQLRIDYDKIPSDFFETEEHINIVAEKKNDEIELFGVTFSIEKMLIVYSDAIINNEMSVKKNVSKKRKRILITIKPKKDKKTFSKYYKFEGLNIVKRA